MGSGAATTHPVPGRCPGHAHCPLAPVRAPHHLPLDAQPESFPSVALRGPLGGQAGPQGRSCSGSTTDNHHAAAATAGKRTPAAQARASACDCRSPRNRSPTWKLPLWVVKRPSNSLSGLGMPGQIFCRRVLLKSLETSPWTHDTEHSTCALSALPPQ